MDSCQLQDLRYREYLFTWNNKRLGEENTKIRLDRGVANGDWRVKFQMSTITPLSTHASYHLPIMLKVLSFQQQRQRHGKAFKFEEAWLLSNEYEETVKEAWGKYEDGSYGLLSIKNKIHVCGLELSRWGSARPDEVAIKEL